MSDLHPIRQAMSEIERCTTHHDGTTVTIGRAVAMMLDVEHSAELERVMAQEIIRARRLVTAHFIEFAQESPGLYSCVGFLQGVTFALAVQRVNAATGER